MSEGPRRVGDRPKRPGRTPPLKRVLRLLASVGVFTEEADGRFALTPIGACLRAGVPGSMRAAALLFGGIAQQAWAIFGAVSRPANRPFAAFSAWMRSTTWRNTPTRTRTSMPRWPTSPSTSPRRSLPLRLLAVPPHRRCRRRRRRSPCRDPAGEFGPCRRALRSARGGQPRKCRHSRTRPGGPLRDRRRRFLQGGAGRRRRLPLEARHPRLG